MSLIPIGPKIESQPLNDNFSFLKSEIDAHMADYNQNVMRDRKQIVTGDWNTYTMPGIYYVNNAQSWGGSNYPPSEAYRWGVLIVAAGNAFGYAQIYLSHSGSPSTPGEMWVRAGDGSGGWRPWVRMAKAVQPVRNALSLLNGVTPLTDCYYSKNEFGQVTVVFSLQKEENFTNGLRIANLPAGYRPPQNISAPVTYNKVGQGTRGAGNAWIGASGDIDLYGSSGAFDQVYACFTFTT